MAVAAEDARGGATATSGAAPNAAAAAAWADCLAAKVQP